MESEVDDAARTRKYSRNERGLSPPVDTDKLMMFVYLKILTLFSSISYKNITSFSNNMTYNNVF